MKKLGLLLLALLLLISCTLDNSTDESNDDDGNLIIKTPAAVYPSMKGIYINNDDAEFSSQKKYRYEIIVEHNGKRVGYTVLKKNQEKSIKVPSGAKLSIFVGLYYAKNSSSLDEKYNVYLATDYKDDIVFRPGTTKRLNFELDLTKDLKVDTYFGDNFGDKGIANITGGIIADNNDPYFSIEPLTDSSSNNARILHYDSGSFSNVTSSTGLTHSGSGKLFEVVADPANDVYWYIQESGIFRGNTGYNGFSSGTPVTSSVSNYLKNVKSIKSIYFSSGGVYYYFLSYGQGYVAVDYNPLYGGWSEATNISFNYLSHIYPYEPFLMDIKQDDTNENYVFFATKIGLFYIDSATLLLFANNQISEALDNCKKVIRITHPDDSSKAILVKKINVTNNNIYIGTRLGVYKIKKSHSEWTSFLSYIGRKQFPEYAISKVEEFYDEPVVSMEEFSTSEGTILVIATPKRVWFKNLSKGETEMITVWDGLPFVPKADYSSAPDLNTKDFQVHEVAPIKFVLWDSDNSRFWIGTDYGLGSVKLNKLF